MIKNDLFETSTSSKSLALKFFDAASNPDLITSKGTEITSYTIFVENCIFYNFNCSTYLVYSRTPFMYQTMFLYTDMILGG